MSVGETDSVSARLSKPSWLTSSGGRSISGSISTPSRSRTALPYSARLRRWAANGRDFGAMAGAARSSAASSQDLNAAYEALSGRGRPAGGIASPRSFRTTFSQASESLATSSRFIAVRDRPAVRSRSLWQATQYLSSSARCTDADPKTELTGGAGACAGCGRRATRVPSCCEAAWGCGWPRAIRAKARQLTVALYLAKRLNGVSLDLAKRLDGVSLENRDMRNPTPLTIYPPSSVTH